MPCPRRGAGLALAIADKLDTLVGIFAIGQKPTGTQGSVRAAPLRARRAAHPDRDRHRARPARADPHRARLDRRGPRQARRQGARPDNLADDIYDYMMERLRAWYLEGGGGVTTEMFDAVLDTRPASPLDFDDRLRALAAFLALPDAASLTAANKRIANILQEGGRAAEPARRSRAPHRSERAPARDRDSSRSGSDVERLVTARRYAEALDAARSLARPASTHSSIT